jgi:hypothetical protein
VELALSLSSMPFRDILNCLVRVLCIMAVVTLNPLTIPMFELRYNPEVAMASWQGSTPAVRLMKDADSAIPLPKPPGIT